VIVGRATLDKPIAIVSARKPPNEIRIFKSGKVTTTKGTFLFDDKSGASVMKKWKAYGNDLMFDYEHYSVSGDSPGDGKAAGWFKLELRDDGLYAVDIKWTDQAATQIAQAEWRYFSPTFDYDKKTGRIRELVNVALTNIPATHNLPALVAAQKDRTPMAAKTAGKKMAPKTKAEIANARLGMKKTKKTVTETEEDAPDAAADDASMDDAETDDADLDEAETDDADLDDAEMDDADTDESDDETDSDDDSDDDDDDMDSDDAAKAKKMKKTDRSTDHAALLAAVHEITGGKTGSEAIGVLRGLRNNSDTVTALSQRVDELQRRSRRDRVKGMVDASIKSGKLMPAQREAFTKIGMRDVKELKGLLDTMPKRVRMSGDEIAESEGKGSAELSEKEHEIVRRAGSLDLYEAAKKDGKLLSLDRFTTEN
jgi:phage I-like protein